MNDSQHWQSLKEWLARVALEPREKARQHRADVLNSTRRERQAPTDYIVGGSGGGGGGGGSGGGGGTGTCRCACAYRERHPRAQAERLGRLVKHTAPFWVY